MKPLMLSALTASLFLILASAIYGSAAIQSAWVAMVFYGLLGAGLAVSILSRRPIP